MFFNKRVHLMVIPYSLYMLHATFIFKEECVDMNKNGAFVIMYKYNNVLYTGRCSA